jgi:MFS family permease
MPLADMTGIEAGMATSTGEGAMAEWRRSWPLPIAAAGGLFTAVLYVYSAGLFIEPLNRAFGWPPTVATLGMMVVGIVAAFGNPFVGMLVDRVGPGMVAMVGVLAYSAALAGLGFAGPGVGSWVIGWILVAFASLAVSVPVWLTAIARAFNRSRGLALAVGYCGSSLAAIVVPLLTERTIEAFGWQGGYRMLGLLALVVGGLSAFTVLRLAPRNRAVAGAAGRGAVRVRLSPQARSDLGSFRFWRIAMMSLLATLGVIALTVHFVSIAVEDGQTRETAAKLAGLIGIAGLIGRLGVGALLDRFPGVLIGPSLYAIPATACLAVALMGSGPVLLVVLALSIGLALGSELDLMAYMTARYFGLAHYGLLFGVLTGIVGCGAGFGPVIAATLRDVSGSYDLLLLLLSGTFVLCGVIVASLGPYPPPDQAA